MFVQTEDSGEVQDLDVARFVLKEVDNAGITMASADRFSARALPTNDTDGEMLLNSFLSNQFTFISIAVEKKQQENDKSCKLH